MTTAMLARFMAWATRERDLQERAHACDYHYPVPSSGCEACRARTVEP